MRLAVKYEGNLDEGLDEKIIQIFENLGFKSVGNSYNFKDGIRKIFFENPNTIEIKENRNEDCSA